MSGYIYGVTALSNSARVGGGRLTRAIVGAEMSFS